LRTDPRSRNEIYQIQRNMGSRTSNEIRAEDDLPPMIGGNDPLPLPVLERMMATTRSIPKSYLPLITMEAEMIADLLQKMEQENPEMVNPVTTAKPPLNKSPQQ